MSLIKKSQTNVTYTISTDAMRELIARDIGVPVDEITVEYVIGNLGPEDPMDRFDPPRGVVGIKVHHKAEHKNA